MIGVGCIDAVVIVAEFRNVTITLELLLTLSKRKVLDYYNQFQHLVEQQVFYCSLLLFSITVGKKTIVFLNISIDFYFSPRRWNILVLF